MMNADKRNPKAIASSASDQTFDALLEQIRGLVQSARKTAATTINSLQVMTSFEIGRMIVEHEQQGAQRAEYGKLVLKTLSDRLAAEFRSRLFKKQSGVYATVFSGIPESFGTNRPDGIWAICRRFSPVMVAIYLSTFDE
jgi:hypothetical protein